jgi:hypothetical protein
VASLSATGARHGLLPRVAARDAVSALIQVVTPPVLKGTIIRRPSMLALAAQLDLDRRGIRCL